MSEHDRQSVLFQALGDRPVLVEFDEPSVTSNGGALLLGVLDRRLGLTERFASAISDRREAGKIQHEVIDLVRQRVHGLACGYSDCNDAARVGADPAMRLLLGRASDDAVASQPTLSRFETRTSPEDIVRLCDALADSVLERHRRRLKSKVKRLTLDLDFTDDLVHGTQQLALFNTHYGGWCYLPLLAFVTFDDEPEQYLIGAFLRPGRTATGGELVEFMKFLLSCVRRHFPRTSILLRGDGGFTSGEMLDYVEDEGLDYLLGMPRNPVLEARSETLLRRARRQSKKARRTIALFDETIYCAKAWKGRARRVIFKAEVTQLEDREARDNPRYVITNLGLAPRNVYKRYRLRGDVENRIKELKGDLDMDRTSCQSHDANQLRVLLTAAAYALLQELRLHVARRLRTRPTAATLRMQLIKIGGRVVSSVRRVVVHLAESHPWKHEWLTISRALAASSA